MVLEARPALEGGQTDFYLELGSTGSPVDVIPGDAWIQFWMCTAHTPSEPSQIGNRNKFLYVCNAGGYPCHDHLWMGWDTASTYNPHNTTPLGFPTNGDAFIGIGSSAGASTFDYNGPGHDPDTRDQIGHQNVSAWLRPNVWYLVKQHFNTTRTTGNSWEAWIQPAGGAQVKVAEWIGGVTPGFTWNIPATHVGGHRALRMPTTVGHASSPSQQFEYWRYMDDFTIASLESDLPTYGTSLLPSAPQNLRIRAADSVALLLIPIWWLRWR